MLQNHLLFGRGFAFILVAVVGLSTQVFSHPTGSEPFGSSTSYYGSIPNDGSLPSLRSPGIQPVEFQSLHGWDPATTSLSPSPDHVPIHPQGAFDHQTQHTLDSHDELPNPVGKQDSARRYLGPVIEANKGSQPGLPSTSSTRSKPVQLFGAPVNHPYVTLKEWQAAMRRALGNPYLEFTEVDGRHPYVSRLFVVKDGTHMYDQHPAEGPLQGQSSNAKGKQHFAQRLGDLEKVFMSNLDLGKAKTRTYIYLNSQSNLRYLNKEYFDNRMHFLPINPQKLHWDTLSTVFSQRKYVTVVPPRTEHGLPLLLAGDEKHAQRMKVIESITGPLEDKGQLVTLWSPVLHAKGRTTVVLYGIAQMNHHSMDGNPMDYLSTIIRLNGLRKEEEDKLKWSAQYYFKENRPEGFPTDLGGEVMETSKLGVK